MDELEMWLGHERRLLERLLFKLVEGRGLLAAGESRFFGLAAAELERAASRVEEAELARGVRLSRLAAEWRVPVERLTLVALGWACPEPYRAMFADHRRAFTDLMAEIDGDGLKTRSLAILGLGSIGPESPDEPMLEAGYRAMLSAATGLSFPSLADFLADHGGPLVAASTSATTRVSSDGRKGLAR